VALGAPGAAAGRAAQAELPLGEEAGDDDNGTEGAPAGEGAALWLALGHDPVTLDALQARTGWPTAELSARLFEWELAGRVARLPGGLYQRVHHG